MWQCDIQYVYSWYSCIYHAWGYPLEPGQAEERRKAQAVLSRGKEIRNRKRMEKMREFHFKPTKTQCFGVIFVGLLFLKIYMFEIRWFFDHVHSLWSLDANPPYARCRSTAPRVQVPQAPQAAPAKRKWQLKDEWGSRCVVKMVHDIWT